MRGRSQPVGTSSESQKSTFLRYFFRPKNSLQKKRHGFFSKTIRKSFRRNIPTNPKYEKGLNRVSARRLQEIAHILDVPVSFFYADSAKKEESPYHCDDRIASKAEYLLLKNFRILTRKKQRAILQLISDEKMTPYFHKFTERTINVLNNLDKNCDCLPTPHENENS